MNIRLVVAFFNRKNEMKMIESEEIKQTAHLDIWFVTYFTKSITAALFQMFLIHAL